MRISRRAWLRRRTWSAPGFDDEDRDGHPGNAARGPRPARPGPARPVAGPGAGGDEAPGVGRTHHATASAVAQRRVRQSGPRSLDPPGRPTRARARGATERPARQAPQAPVRTRNAVKL